MFKKLGQPSLKSIEKNMDASNTYADWHKLAHQHDTISEKLHWRKKEASNLYNSSSIRARTDHLMSLLEEKNYREILHTLNEGIHGNIDGIGKPILYNQAKTGTKELINEYIDTVIKALVCVSKANNKDISSLDKLDFFRRASHCFGRSALMLSGGGGLVYFHHGVAQTLIDHQLLPNVLSGASAGSWMCAQLGTQTDKELENNYFFDKTYQLREDLGQHAFLKVIMGLDKRYSPSEFLEDCLDQFTDDLTFQEAYEKTGRYINISIAPAEKHQASRLMNAITSPNVYIRSAVLASSSVPGVVPPVRLYAKGATGKPKPYLSSQRWVDGSFADDLPAKRLSRLFGVNHFIVSLINPAVLPFISDPKIQFNSGWGNTLVSTTIKAAQKTLSNAERICSRYNIDSLRPSILLADALINQKYTGDINIILDKKDYQWRDILFGYRDEQTIHELKMAGARSTWQKLEMIRNNTRIAQTIDKILETLDHEYIAATQGATKRRITS